MKIQRLLLMTVFFIFNFSLSFAAQFDNVYKSSISYFSNYYDYNNTQHQYIAISCVVDNASFPVFVKNIPGAPGDIKLVYLSGWSNFYPYTFVYVPGSSDVYPGPGPAYEGAEYTFYIDENDDSLLNAGEPTDTFTLTSGALKNIGFVQNVNVTCGKHPAISWTGIDQYSNLKYRILIFSTNTDDSPNMSEPLFISDFIEPESGNTFSYKYSDSLFDEVEMYTIAVEATEYVDSRIINRSRYFINHCSIDCGDVSQFSLNFPPVVYPMNNYYSNRDLEYCYMLMGAIVNMPCYNVFVKNIPNTTADLNLSRLTGWDDCYPFSFGAGLRTSMGFPDAGPDYENIEYTFYVDENDNGSLDVEEPEDTFSLTSGSINKLGFVENVNVSSNCHPAITWKGVEHVNELIYRIKFFPVAVNNFPDTSELLFQSDRIEPLDSTSYSYQYLGNLFVEYEKIAIGIEATDVLNERIISRSRYFIHHSPDDADEDGDGYTVKEGDCNDNDATIYLGAIEICDDGIDQDCDGNDLACILPPTAPRGLAANAVSYRKILLRWTDQSIDEDGFKIERKKRGCNSSFAWFQVATVSENVNTYNDVGFDPDTQYSYRVRAYRGSSNSEYSNCGTTVSGVSGTPSAPINLVASYVSSSKVDLTWDEWSTNVTEFKIYREKNDFDSWTLLATTGPTTFNYSDTQATGNQTTTGYCYYVQACNDNGCSPTTYTVCVPFNPTGLTATAGSGKIILNWEDNSDNERGFELYRKTGNCLSSASWEKVKSAGIDRTTVSDKKDLIPGTTYSYKIRAYCRSWGLPYVYGYSDWSDCVSVTNP